MDKYVEHLSRFMEQQTSRKGFLKLAGRSALGLGLAGLGLGATGHTRKVAACPNYAYQYQYAKCTAINGACCYQGPTACCSWEGRQVWLYAEVYCDDCLPSEGCFERYYCAR